MRKIVISASKEYPIFIGTGLLENLGDYICKDNNQERIMIASDDTVFSLYGEIVREALLKKGWKVDAFVFPHGESQKNIHTYACLLEKMTAFEMSRKDVLLALGGGVVGDLTGFAAATYQRGVSYIQVPTTLLSMVDSSVGGKTAIDLPNGKNQVGCFYQPNMVICDINTLKTLDESEYINGSAEIIKYAMLDGEELFQSISNIDIKDQYEDVIEKCIKIKKRYVEKDENDVGVRMLLNFGHTIGHAIETCSNYQIPHGQAVAMGMLSIAKASAKFSLCDNTIVNRLEILLSKYGLSKKNPISVDALKNTAMLDKKNTSRTMRLIIPIEIGKCIVHEINKEDFEEWLRAGEELK